ncbi:MAG: protein kinase [Acidobacteria bacterium]|nr:protein kinase [Acidobacteriota bacterium]
MTPTEPSLQPGGDHDARLLGLALLHGYVGVDQLKAAADLDPTPSAILEELKRAGVLDAPSMEGLEQGLKEVSPSLSRPHRTGHTSSGPPDPEGDRPTSALGAQADPPTQSLEADPEDREEAAILRRLRVPSWKQYRNLRFVGEGGMGRIFKALDPNLKRTVALKFLRVQDAVQLRRFLFEAQAQALLEHPSICKVYEVGEWRGQHYLAMQFVNGPTLQRLAPRLALDAKLQILETVAEAVHEAHRSGLIHRDLKPANILVEELEGGGHRAFVLDFGLAFEMGAPGLTGTGQVMGTTSYMAPEQARGESHRIDRRTDVYGLGATMYEVFTGAPPHGDAQGLTCMQKIVDEEPRPLRKAARGLPRDLEIIVMKCLEKEPGRRYDDARALAEDLRRLRLGEPILARRASVAYRLGRFARRNRALVGVSLLALVAFLALGGVAAAARFTASARERHAQHFGQEAERIEALLRYAHIQPAHDIQREMRAIRARMKAMEDLLAGRPGLEEAPAAYALGRAHLALGETRDALRLLERAWGLGLQNPDVAYTYGRALGEVYQVERSAASRIRDEGMRRDRLSELENTFKPRTLAFLRQGQGATLEPADFMEAILALHEQRFDDAHRLAGKAAAEAPWFYEALALEARVHLARALAGGRPEQAGADLEEAWHFLRQARLLAPSDPSLWDLETQGRLQAIDLMGEQGLKATGAEAELLSGCREWARLQPSDPGPPARRASGLALLARRTLGGGASEREIRATRARAEAEAVLSSHPGHPEALEALALACFALEHAEEELGKDARPTLQKMIQACEQALPSGAPRLAMIELMAGATLLLVEEEKKRGGDAQARWRNTVSLLEQELALSPGNSGLHANLGNLLLEQADTDLQEGRDPSPLLDKALPMIQRALDLEPTRFRYRYYLGQAHYVRAERDFRAGRDPRADLARCRAANEEVVRVNPRLALGHAALANAALLEAEFMVARGQDPAPLLAVVEQELAKVVQAGSHPRKTAWLLGQAHLLRAEWLLRSAPAQALPWLRKAEALFTPPGPPSGNPQVLVLKARVYRLWSHLPGEGSRRRALALQALAQAESLNGRWAAIREERSRLGASPP